MSFLIGKPSTSFFTHKEALIESAIGDPNRGVTARHHCRLHHLLLTKVMYKRLAISASQYRVHEHPKLTGQGRSH